jgi:hypothetical protein
MFIWQEDADLTTEDKINYIYTELRKGERDRIAGNIFKWAWRIAIFSGLFYTYLFPESLFNTAKMISKELMPSPQMILQGLPSDLITK